MANLDPNMNLQSTPTQQSAIPDFTDTEVAFAHLSDQELRRMEWLFSLMNKPWLVNTGSFVGLWSVKWNLPFARSIICTTLFSQFVGGESLLKSLPTIEKLAANNTLTVLDYGVENKETEEDFNATLRENLRAIEFASGNDHVPVVSTKISGLASNPLLEKIQRGDQLSKSEEDAFKAVVKRVEALAMAAHEKGVAVFFDAEESWIQQPIDDMVNTMMKRYNKDRVVVYNTYQLYRHDRLAYMIETAEKAKAEGWMLGAKIVRGAYMEKERLRAKEMGYPSPIYPDKPSTDQAYDDAVRFLVENYTTIASCNATHNAKSCMKMAAWIDELRIDRDRPHLNFSQLYGMSDHLTFNLANSGYNVAKYVPYGRVEEVIPYLLRRAQENSSVTGEMSRELELIHTEVKRRGL